jgi:WD40 repeat protein
MTNPATRLGLSNPLFERSIQMTRAWGTFLTVAALMLLAGVPASSRADEQNPLPVAKPQDIETVTEFLKTQPRNFIFNGSVMWLTFMPDGKTLASSSRDATIGIWEFSSDGRRVVAGGSEKTVFIWDTQTGECLHKLQSSEDAFEAVVISPDDKVVAANSSSGPVIIWDAASGKLLHTLTGHVQEGDSMDFRPDGKILATGNKDRTIAFWDTTTWKKVGLFIGNDSRIESIMYSPDGRWLANGGGGGSTSIKLWAVTGKSN